MKKRLTIITLVLAVIVGATYLYLAQKTTTDNPQTKQDAIEQAKAYRPEGICTQAIVPAVHTATGAKYTFSSGCLAPGWEPDR